MLLKENISLQNTIIEKIKSVIKKFTSLSNIETFENNPMTQDSIKLTPNNCNNSELNNYINSYNDSIALLDDPNHMTKAAFDTYLHIQDNKINKLNANLAILNDKIKTKNIPPVKGFRSMNNSSILNAEEYPNPSATNNGQPNSSSNTYNGNNSSTYPNYLIYGNNGCLQYEPSSTINKNTPSWNFKSCDANESKQQFTTTLINNLDKYNNPITNSINQKYMLRDSTNTQLGFYTVNPNNAYDQCLQLNNDGLSIMPCTMESAQRFKPTYHSVLE